MLHDLLASYLKGAAAAVGTLHSEHVELYEEEVLSSDRLNLRIRVRLVDGSLLEINEAVIVREEVLQHLGYRYHFQDGNGRVVFRYDNTPHFRDIPTFPDHKHTATGVLQAHRPSIIKVIEEIGQAIPSESDLEPPQQAE
jgi:hypothetical protein